jgi:hypothetical protein
LLKYQVVDNKLIQGALGLSWLQDHTMIRYCYATESFLRYEKD